MSQNASTDLQDEGEDLDLTLRHISRRYPDQLARALLPPGAVITSATWAETQLTARQRRLDRALDVTVGGVRRFEHVEMQLEMDPDVPFRVYEYHVLKALTLAGERKAGEQAPRIRSTVVLMSGRAKRWPMFGEYRTSPEGEPFSGVQFRIDAVYQRTVAELSARGCPLWMIFAPLAVDADPERMKEVVERLRAETSEQDFGELSAAMTVVAEKDKRQRGLRGAILSLLRKEDVMRSAVYMMGREDERKVRQDDLARLYEKRLGRPLDDAERACLIQRLGSLGFDRLVDVRDDLSGDALAGWLRDPDAA